MNNKRGKRAQVTLFVILAIFIIVLVLGFFFFREKIIKPKPTPPEALEIKAYVQECLNVVSQDALFIVGKQGGYSEPILYLDTNDSDIGRIAYWYYKGKDVKPDITKIQTELSDYINLALPLCLDLGLNEGLFNDINISYDKAITKTTIGQNIIAFQTSFPITIKKQGSIFKLDNFETRLNFNFRRIYSLASQLSYTEATNPNFIPLSSYLADGFDIAIIPYDDKTTIYTISDNSSVIYNQSYIFTFANNLK